MLASLRAEVSSLGLLEPPAAPRPASPEWLAGNEQAMLPKSRPALLELELADRKGDVAMGRTFGHGGRPSADNGV